MIGAEAELARRAEHAVRGLATDDAGFEVESGAGDMRARRREHAFHAGAGVGRAADHLHHALAGIDAADPQAIGVGMLLGFRDIADHEGGQRLRRVLDALDLEAEIGELGRDGGRFRARLEMCLQPGQGELHRVSPPTTDGTSSGMKP